MKHFVYLDTDILNSYLSQINDGLLKSSINESKDEISRKQDENNMPGKSTSKTEIGFRQFFNFGLSEEKDIVTTTNTLMQIESGRELIEKILHDNAFEQLRKYLSETNKLKDDKKCNLGEYLKIKGKYSIRDLDYIINYYTDEFIEFMGDEALKDNIKKIKNIRDDKKKLLIDDLERKKSKTIEDQKNIKRIFEIAQTIVPYSKFLFSDGYMIPLNEKFLREDTGKLRFSYSEEITILGKYTSSLGEAIEREVTAKTSFDNIYKALDNALKVFYIDIFGMKEEYKIIQPIALYFE